MIWVIVFALVAIIAALRFLWAIPVVRNVLVGLLIGAASVALGYWWGDVHVSNQWNVEKAAAAAKQQAVAVAQVGVTKSIDTQVKSDKTQIQVVYRDRIKTQIKEVPHEVIVRENAACTIPERFVSVWNTANAVQVPTAAQLVDESPSGVVLTDVEAQHDRESKLASENLAELKGWQTWARQQCTLTGTQGCDAIGAADPPKPASSSAPAK